jgi:hypothetical protein
MEDEGIGLMKVAAEPPTPVSLSKTRTFVSTPRSDSGYQFKTGEDSHPRGVILVD